MIHSRVQAVYNLNKNDSNVSWSFSYASCNILYYIKVIC